MADNCISREAWLVSCYLHGSDEILPVAPVTMAVGILACFDYILGLIDVVESQSLGYRWWCRYRYISS